MDIISIAIVTCKRDFKKLKCCLESIKKFNIINANIEIIIVVNDLLECVYDVVSLTNQQKNIKVVHYTEISEWPKKLDWFSQQYFKLAVASIISTPWYLILDSDDLITKHVPADFLFNNGAAVRRNAKLVANDLRSPKLQSLLIKAFDLWYTTRPYILPDTSMGDVTPFIMHTNTVCQMLPYVDKNWFDPFHPNYGTLEFYLYYAYLEYYDLVDTLYVDHKFWNLSCCFEKLDHIPAK
jgi:hypothetical protein